MLVARDSPPPDGSVSCDRRDRTTAQYITYPCLILEVLSDSTEAYDRGNKFFRYRQNPQLQDYLLVSSSVGWGRQVGDHQPQQGTGDHLEGGMPQQFLQPVFVEFGFFLKQFIDNLI